MASPLQVRKVSLRRTTKAKPKVSTKKFSLPRGQQNTHTVTKHYETKAEKSSPVKAHRSNRHRRGILRHPLRRRPPRNGRSFPPSGSSQRSISLLKFIILRSIVVLLVLCCATKTDRSFSPTFTHVHTQVHKETSNVCIAPIFVPFCDKYLILSF